MKGKVNNRREAIIKLRIQGFGSQRRRIIDAVIDTGYTGTLTLPAAVIKSLKLRRVAQSVAQLADGSLVPFNVFLALLEWDGNVRPIRIDEAPAEALIGMSLLAGHDLAVRVKKGGAVTISKY